jgi:hypothetical protein
MLDQIKTIRGPVAVLTNLKVETVQDVAQVVEHYMSRWSGYEDPIPHFSPPSTSIPLNY